LLQGQEVEPAERLFSSTYMQHLCADIHCPDCSGWYFDLDTHCRDHNCCCV